MIEYPGRAERMKCAQRTRTELAQFAATRSPGNPLDEVQLAWMNARCSRCRACPAVVGALKLMAPAKAPPASAPVVMLARSA